MSTESYRKNYGTTGQGEVVVIGKTTLDDQERPHVVYEVRHGVRTVDSGLSKTKAEDLAKALTA